jgi:hypothetical protein
MRSIGLVKKDH